MSRTIRYFLPLHRRSIGLIFPLLILVIAGLITPTFMSAGLPWWPLFVLCLPGLLAIIIAIEFWNVAIGFDAEGVHYRSVGYSVSAPWKRVSERRNGNTVSLNIEACEPRYHWWLGMMQAVLSVFLPGRARYANGLMATIPLSWFSTGPGDAVMVTYARAIATAE